MHLHGEGHEGGNHLCNESRFVCRQTGKCNLPSTSSTTPLQTAAWTEIEPSGSRTMREKTVPSKALWTFLQGTSQSGGMRNSVVSSDLNAIACLNLSWANIGMILCSMVSAAEQLSPQTIDGYRCTARVTSFNTVASSRSLPA